MLLKIFDKLFCIAGFYGLKNLLLQIFVRNTLFTIENHHIYYYFFKFINFFKNIEFKDDFSSNFISK